MIKKSAFEQGFEDGYAEFMKEALHPVIIPPLLLGTGIGGYYVGKKTDVAKTHPIATGVGTTALGGISGLTGYLVGRGQRKDLKKKGPKKKSLKKKAFEATYKHEKE